MLQKAINGIYISTIGPGYVVGASVINEMSFYKTPGVKCTDEFIRQILKKQTEMTFNPSMKLGVHSLQGSTVPFTDAQLIPNIDAFTVAEAKRITYDWIEKSKDKAYEILLAYLSPPIRFLVKDEKDNPVGWVSICWNQLEVQWVISFKEYENEMPRQYSAKETMVSRFFQKAA